MAKANFKTSSSPKLGVDLLRASQLELSFLSAVDDRGSLFYSEDFVRCAVHRYENVWLGEVVPASSSSAEEDLLLAPPMDVHWVWHVHMLSPTDYQRDCMEKCGRVVAHRLRSMEELERLREETRERWEACSYEPFELGGDAVKDLLPKVSSSSLSYDVVSAASRQRSFFYQVSLPHYRQPRFLSEALERYSKFLRLKALNPGTFLVPCYDIDLMWHTHQVHPVQYAEDCRKNLGKVLPHDDSVTDRQEGSKLSTAYEKTVELWEAAFPGSKFQKPGAMYRGDAPNGRLSSVSVTDVRTRLFSNPLYNVKSFCVGCNV